MAKVDQAKALDEAKVPVVEEIQTDGMTLKVDYDPRRDKNGLRMTFTDCSVNIEEKDSDDPDAKRKVGHVRACFGGGVEVSIEDGRSFFLSPKEIWNAVQRAIGKEDQQIG